MNYLADECVQPDPGLSWPALIFCVSVLVLIGWIATVIAFRRHR